MRRTGEEEDLMKTGGGGREEEEEVRKRLGVVHKIRKTS